MNKEYLYVELNLKHTVTNDWLVEMISDKINLITDLWCGTWQYDSKQMEALQKVRKRYDL